MNYEQQIRRDYVLGRFLGGAILGGTIASFLFWLAKISLAVALPATLGAGVVTGILTVQYGASFWRWVVSQWPWFP